MAVRNLFEDNDIWDRFYKVALSWKGTPFLHFNMTKQGGADCSTFIGGILLEAGLLTEVELEYYPTNWYLTNPNMLLESVENHLKNKLISGLNVQRVSTDQPMFRGDIFAIWTYKKEIANHSAIYLGNDEVIHCRWGTGVETKPYLHSAFEFRLKNIFRIVKEV